METARQNTPRTSTRTSSTARRPRAPRRAGTKPSPVGEARTGPLLTHEAIARRAYDLFERSGQVHGRDVEFWLAAEGQLRESQKS